MQLGVLSVTTTLLAAPLFWGLIELNGGYALPFALVMIANVLLGLLLVRRSGFWQ